MCSWPEVWIRNRNRPKTTHRTTSRTNRYSSDAFASGRDRARRGPRRRRRAPRPSPRARCDRAAVVDGRAPVPSGCRARRRSTGSSADAGPSAVSGSSSIGVGLLGGRVLRPRDSVARPARVRPRPDVGPRLIARPGHPRRTERTPCRRLGMGRRSIAHPAPPVAHDEADRPDGDERQRHDLGGRDAEERPVVRTQELEGEARGAVPDEEDEQQVSRGAATIEAGSRGTRGTTNPIGPEIDSYRNSGWNRVVSGSVSHA